MQANTVAAPDVFVFCLHRSRRCVTWNWTLRQYAQIVFT